MDGYAEPYEQGKIRIIEKRILWRRIKMDKLQYIRENEQLNILLMNE